MRGFLEKVLRTNGRTDGRTDGGELIGPISASGRGPKIMKIYNSFWKIFLDSSFAVVGPLLEAEMGPINSPPFVRPSVRSSVHNTFSRKPRIGCF